MTSATTRLEEAGLALKRGEDALKTGIFKWKPEFEIAALEFERSGNLYKQCNVHDRARDAFEKAANAHHNNNIDASAARLMELAANSAQQAKKSDDVIRCWESAASFYLSTGQGDRATECYEKVAKYLESEQKFAEAVKFLGLAIEQYKSDNRLRFALDSYRKCLQMYLRGSDYMGAIDFLDRQIRDLVASLPNDTTVINRACIACMIVCAKMGDPVEMEKRFVEYQEVSESFFMSEEGQIATTLVDAYRDRDQDLLSSIMKKQSFLFMDNEVVRLAKSLVVPGSGTSSLPLQQTPARLDLFATKSTTTVDQNTIAPAPNYNQDEDDNALC